MKTRNVILLTAFAVAVAATTPMMAREQVPPPPGGMLRTLPQGTYQCALPGDAAGKAFEIVSKEEFRIGAASRYSNAEGSGTYILRGDHLTFTGGPKKGQQYKRVGTNQLRKLDGKVTTKLLCTRLGSSG